MVARETQEADKGLFLCVKGGSNGDSHNHNDVGNYVVFYNARPILIDIGVEVYRRSFLAQTAMIYGPSSHNIIICLPSMVGCSTKGLNTDLNKYAIMQPSK